MERENIPAGVLDVVPILFIPKQCTKLEINCESSENVFIDLSILSPDTEGNQACIYSGFCKVKLIESCNINIYTAETIEVEHENSSNSSIDSVDINQMPVIFSDANTLPTEPYNQSKVWIDPSRSPYVYNHYDTSTQQTYSIHERPGCITVQQHNTYVTQNVYNYDHQSQSTNIEQNHFKNTPDTRNKQDSPGILYDDEESESEVCLSQLSKRMTNREMEKCNLASIQEKNKALTQLMLTEIESTSKQRKTILFLGKDSTSGQTIQNIQYTDPMIECTAIEVDHEVVIEDAQSPTPNKKKFQCDKCKQIFDQISDFRHHIVGNHTNTANYHSNAANKTLACFECGRKFSDSFKYQAHCAGHGDPDLECHKCRKVYASKNNLKIHMEIHKRKFACPYCTRTYATFESYKTHLKLHSKYMCQYNGCNFMANSEAKLNDHQDDHIEGIIDRKHNYDFDDLNDNRYDEVEDHGKGNINYRDDNVPVDKECVTKESNTEIIFEQDLITAECMKAEIPGELESNDKRVEVRNKTKEVGAVDGTGDVRVKNDTDVEDRDEKIKRANFVIANVMSNKIFLANSKMAKKHARINKTCGVCVKRFDRVGDLKRHLIEHVIKSTLVKTVSSEHGTLNITCEICHLRSFNSVDKYKEHLREHAKLTIYRCTFCDKSFSDSSNFSKHKKIHGVSYYQCDLCNRKFNSKMMIAKHIELHSKSKPLKCKQCHRVFHFESMLKKHVKSTHNKPVVSRFPCRFCGGGFTTLRDKWDHEWVVHNIRKMIVDCLRCGAKFRKFSELKTHCLTEHEINIPARKKLLKKKVV